MVRGGTIAVQCDTMSLCHQVTALCSGCRHCWFRVTCHRPCAELCVILALPCSHTHGITQSVGLEKTSETILTCEWTLSPRAEH